MSRKRRREDSDSSDNASSTSTATPALTRSSTPASLSPPTSALQQGAGCKPGHPTSSTIPPSTVYVNAPAPSNKIPQHPANNFQSSAPSQNGQPVLSHAPPPKRQRTSPSQRNSRTNARPPPLTFERNVVHALIERYPYKDQKLSVEDTSAFQMLLALKPWRAGDIRQLTQLAVEGAALRSAQPLSTAPTSLSDLNAASARTPSTCSNANAATLPATAKAPSDVSTSNTQPVQDTMQQVPQVRKGLKAAIDRQAGMASQRPNPYRRSPPTHPHYSTQMPFGFSSSSYGNARATHTPSNPVSHSPLAAALSLLSRQANSPPTITSSLTKLRFEASLKHTICSRATNKSHLRNMAHELDKAYMDLLQRIEQWRRSRMCTRLGGHQ